MSTQALPGAAFDTYAYADPFLAQYEGGTGVAYGTDNAVSVVNEAQAGDNTGLDPSNLLAFGGYANGSEAQKMQGSDSTSSNNALNGNDEKCAAWLSATGMVFPGCDSSGKSTAGKSGGDPIMLILIGLLAVVLIGVGVWSLVK